MTTLRALGVLLMIATACAPEPARVAPSSGVGAGSGGAEGELGDGLPDDPNAQATAETAVDDVAWDGDSEGVASGPVAEGDTSVPAETAPVTDGHTDAPATPTLPTPALPARRSVVCMDTRSTPAPLRDALLRNVAGTAPEGVTAAMTANLAQRFDRLAIVSTGAPWLVLVGHHPLGTNPVMANDAQHQVRAGYSIVGTRDAVRAVAAQSDAELDALTTCAQRHIGFRTVGRTTLDLGGGAHEVEGAEGRVVPGTSADLQVALWADFADAERATAAEREVRSNVDRYRNQAIVGGFVRNVTVRRDGRRLHLETPMSTGQAALLIGFLQGLLQTN